jgi:hypothetical protein
MAEGVMPEGQAKDIVEEALENVRRQIGKADVTLEWASVKTGANERVAIVITSDRTVMPEHGVDTTNRRLSVSVDGKPRVSIVLD